MHKKKINLGIVGCGDISDRFFKQASALEDVEMIAACAKHLLSAAKKAEIYQVPHVYDDYMQMMEQETLDGVIIATPHSVHAEVALAAFARGLHVLNEKPMATSFTDCVQMVEAAEKNNCLFMSLPYDVSPALSTAIACLKDGSIGKITGAEAQLSLPGPPRDNWYYDRSISHGGAILDCMVYPLSRLIALIGPVKSVIAEVNTLIPNRIVGGGVQIQSDVDDNATVILEFGDGQHAVVRTLWGMSLVQNNTIVYGRKGTVALNDSGYNVVVHSPDRPIAGGVQVNWRGNPDCYVPAGPPSFGCENDILQHFVDCLRGGDGPFPSARQQLHVHEIMFGAYESARTGSRYQLTTSFEPWSGIDPSVFDTKNCYI